MQTVESAWQAGSHRRIHPPASGSRVRVGLYFAWPAGGSHRGRYWFELELEPDVEG